MNEQRTPPGEKFPRWCRLIHRLDYQHAFREGRALSIPGFKIVVRYNHGSGSRLGLAVSRKVGNAVVRNRMKRRLREIFRRNRDELPVGVDIVVVPFRGSAELTFEQIRQRVVDGILAGYARLEARGARGQRPKPPPEPTSDEGC